MSAPARTLSRRFDEILRRGLAEFAPGADARALAAQVKKLSDYYLIAPGQATPWDQVAGDLAAAIAALKPPVFVAGYCWGGAATWLAACRCDGVAATKRITEEFPGIKIIALSMHNSPDIVARMKQAGAYGYLTKESAGGQLCRAIVEAALSGPLGSRGEGADVSCGAS